MKVTNEPKFGSAKPKNGTLTSSTEPYGSVEEYSPEPPSELGASHNHDQPLTSTVNRKNSKPFIVRESRVR